MSASRIICSGGELSERFCVIMVNDVELVWVAWAVDAPHSSFVLIFRVTIRLLAIRYERVVKPPIGGGVLARLCVRIGDALLGHSEGNTGILVSEVGRITCSP